MPHSSANMRPAEANLHVARDASEAVEFLARSGGRADGQRTQRIARLILLDFEASKARGAEIAEFIRRAL